MSYTSYTTDNVFTDPRINAVCDYMLDQLAIAFPPEVSDPDNFFVFHSCILSGKAAAILRGDEGLIRNVTFQVDRQPLYDWLVQNLGTKLFNCLQISFKNRILFYPQPDLYFEIWYSDIELSPAGAGGIFIQNSADIPPQTL